MFQEKWRPVVGFEDAYEVSNTGRVRSIGRYVKSRWGQTWYNMHELKIQTSKKGYKTVVLHRDGDYYQKQVHRLVAEAFIPNPENMEQVNHKDTDKANNNVSNLEWCTQRENVNHSKERYCHAKSTIKANTGYKYISLTKKGVYRVSSRQRGIDKRFKTLEEAILYRNEAMHEICFAK